MSAKRAIQIVKRTGKLTEAIAEALGGNRIYDIKETGEATQQSQVWFCANQDALNQFLLRLEDKLPEAKFSVADHDNGSIAGFAVTVSGVYADHDVASLAGVKGIVRLDGPNSDLK